PDGDYSVNQITDSQGRTFSFDHDATTGMVTKITDSADTRSWQYSYDTGGHLKTYTDPKGKITQYTYDGNENLIKIVDPRGSTTYNANGGVLSYTSATQAAYGYSYDLLDNRPMTATDPKADGTSGGLTTSLSYDDTNHGSLTDPLHWLPQTATDAQSHTLTFGYDTNGNLQSVQNQLAQQNTLNLHYNAGDGTLHDSVDADGNTTTYSYDPNNGNLIG